MTLTSPLAQRSSNAFASGKLQGYVPGVILLTSLALSWALFSAFRPADAEYEVNLIVVVLAAIAIFAVLLWGVSYRVEGRRRAVDRLASLLVSFAFLVALTPLISLVITVLTNGLVRFDADFFTLSMRNVVGEGGGAAHAMIGTLIMTLTAGAISVPIGLLTSIYIVEYGAGKRLTRWITFFVDVMTGIPSIVAGLFAYSLFEILLGPGTRVGVSGSAALTVLMIPIVVRSSEEMLRLVPNELREASFALGVPKWLTILKVVLPTSIAGITTGVMLAIARVIGETAPLLIAAGFSNDFNFNLFQDRMQSLPNFVYYSYVAQGSNPEAYLDRAWAGALTLILIVMVLNIGARLIARFFAPKTSR
ncbi:MAG: phosphate ABC transporter permease PstA [Microbacteriaceae bacterium]|jgi:phosphate transport system permease protein|nr:phosphate ABC transporter permease PstA [Microbacteriaceae bacterium]